MKRKRLTSILGIQLTRDRLAAVEMRSRGGHPTVERSLDTPLAIDVLNTEAELAGREIQSRLESAGIRARRCVLCLPAESLLIQTIDLTGVGEEDVESLLELEAERGFPFAPEDLVLASSRYTDLSGKPFATLAAVASSQLDPWVQALRKAKLQVVGVTPGPPALLEEGRAVDAALVAERSTLTLAVGMAGGLALLRSFTGVSATGVKPAGDGPDGDACDELGRELRLTLRRIPTDARASLKRVRIFGVPSGSHRLMETVEEELKEAGLSGVAAGVSASGEIAEGQSGQGLPTLVRVSMRLLSGRAPVLEFWRPREGVWRSRVRRLLARGVLVRLGMAAGLVVVLIVAAFSIQGWRLASLQKRWSAMKPDATQLEAIQEGIRERQPWLSSSANRLDILRALTSAFPETGSVWVRTVEIRQSNAVTCLGFGRSNRDCLRVLEALRKTPGVTDLQVEQVRGDKPVQFSFQYKWQKDVKE